MTKYFLFATMMTLGLAAPSFAASKVIQCETNPNSGIFSSPATNLVTLEVSVRESRISVQHVKGHLAGERYNARIYAPSYTDGYGMSVLTAFKQETHPEYKLVKVGVTSSLLTAALQGRAARGRGFLTVDLYKSSTGAPNAFSTTILDKGDVVILNCEVK